MISTTIKGDDLKILRVARGFTPRHCKYTKYFKTHLKSI